MICQSGRGRNKKTEQAECPARSLVRLDVFSGDARAPPDILVAASVSSDKRLIGADAPDSLERI